MAIGLDYLVRLQEELHIYIGEQESPKGLASLEVAHRTKRLQLRGN